MSKSIYISDKNLNAFKVSKEEALLKGLGRWKNWYCAAGSENLHISADGNAFAATCKVQGLLHNVFDSNIDFSTDWIRCDKEICACGSDMEIRKVKDRNSIPVAKQLHSSQLKFHENDSGLAEIVGPVFDEGPRVSITWDLGRRCNFSCTYCNSSISNNFESHKSKGSLEFAYKNLKEKFIRGRQTKFIFTGGEPTLNPAYAEFVKMIASDGHLIHTQTNGSLAPEFYSELIKSSFIGISVHLQFFNSARLLKNIHAILSTIQSDPKYQFQWFGVRIMAPPQQVQQAAELFSKINEIKMASKSTFELVMSPVYEKNEASKIQNYTPEEFDLLQKHI